MEDNATKALMDGRVMDTEPAGITARLAGMDTAVIVTLIAHAVDRYIERVPPDRRS